MKNERITIAEAERRGYRKNCNGEWLRRRAPGHPTDDKEYFIGEEVMTEIEAELLAALKAMTEHLKLLNWGAEDYVIREKALAAIAKAEGK